LGLLGLLGLPGDCGAEAVVAAAVAAAPLFVATGLHLGFPGLHLVQA